ncbi:GerMN domain-containing protein [Rhabdothermincola salaria]|uniref:GerMN domain-containing protein n=1 Tax=Rhabdothermincola salaria TaxID=2903142 RepID=UPI001E5C7297|nr:GerMN domain-containing protein [Rhabdothermincola salaria]MCD9622905.1 GerMN domain-containing protein [Rhabdothermincola salaria]
MTRLARLLVLLGLGLVVAGTVLAGCGISPDDSPRAQPDEDVPFGLLERGDGATTTVAAPTAVPISICLVRTDGQLVSIPRDFAPNPSLSEVLGALGDPPTDAERTLGLSTAISDDAVVNEVRTSAGVANVDLGAGVVEGSARNQLAAVAQIVCTLTQQPGIGQVRFLVDGVNVEVARGDGSTTADAVSRRDYATVMPS